MHSPTTIQQHPCDAWHRAEELFSARDYLIAATVSEGLLTHPDTVETDLAQGRELLERAADDTVAAAHLRLAEALGETS